MPQASRYAGRRVAPFRLFRRPPATRREAKSCDRKKGVPIIQCPPATDMVRRSYNDFSDGCRGFGGVHKACALGERS